MKNIIFLLGLVLGSQLAYAQISGTFGQVAGHYISNTDGGGFREMQIGLRTSVGLDIGQHISTGLKIQQLWYRDLFYDFEHMWLAGPFVRYGTKINTKGRGFLELGFNRGNYCSCSPLLGDHFKEDGLNYVVWGGGVEVQIRPGMYLNGEMFFHYIINRPQPKYGYNGYLLGLVFHLSQFNLSS